MQRYSGTIGVYSPFPMPAPVFNVTDAWKAAYPGATVGILAMSGVSNPSSHPDVEALKKAKQDELTVQFAGKSRADLKEIDIIKAYEEYYGVYGKQYHVLLQLESIAIKGKPFASTGALVQVMFVAEVGNLLLTAGHDIDTLKGELTLDVADGTEEYLSYRGDPQFCKKGDMIISDSEAVTSSIVLGPDQRTRINSGTKNVLYAAYAPAGIGSDAMRKHMEDIRDGVHLFSSGASVDFLEVFEA